MDFGEYQKNLEELIDQNKNKINDDHLLNKLKLSVRTMIEDIALLSEGKEKLADHVLIEEVIIYLADLLLNVSINELFCKLINKYTELTYNWNQNCCQNKMVKVVCLLMSRLEETRTSMLVSIESMKAINERQKDLAGWTPPIFELAKEYLDQLLIENETKKGVTE